MLTNTFSNDGKDLQLKLDADEDDLHQIIVYLYSQQPLQCSLHDSCFDYANRQVQDNL